MALDPRSSYPWSFGISTRFIVSLLDFLIPSPVAQHGMVNLLFASLSMSKEQLYFVLYQLDPPCMYKLIASITSCTNPHLILPQDSSLIIALSTLTTAVARTITSSITRPAIRTISFARSLLEHHRPPKITQGQKNICTSSPLHP